MSQYLQKAKSPVDELAAAGRPLSNAEFNAIIYRNLGYEFYSIITAVNQRPTPVTFQELHGQLVAHEVLIKSTQESPVANFVNRQNSTPSFRKRPQYSPLTASPTPSNYSPRFSNPRPFTTYRRPKGPSQIHGHENIWLCHLSIFATIQSI